MMNTEEIMAKITAIKTQLDDLTAAIGGEAGEVEEPEMEEGEVETPAAPTETPATTEANAPTGSFVKKPKNDLMKALKL